MKKSLIALAALAAVGVASAQSSVSISGGMALGVGSTKFGTASSGLQIARHTGNVAFSGTEDLGGGLRAGFRLETSIGGVATTNITNTGSADNLQVANRTILGDRGANMTVAGGFGTVLVGRAPTAIRALWGAIGDVSRLQQMTTLSAGSSAASNNDFNGGLTVAAGDTNARIIYGDTFANQVSWTSPTVNGFTVGVGYVGVQTSSTGVGDNATNKDTHSISVRYTKGQIDAAYNLTDTKGGSTPNKAHTMLARYDFGVARVGVSYQDIKLSSGVNPGAATAITANIPMGAGSIGLAYGKRSASASTATSFGDDVKHTSLGYRYDLSKRTNVAVIWNKLDRSGGTTTDIKEQHIVLAHTF